MKDRHVHPEDVNDLMRLLAENHLCELIYECEKPAKNFVQFTLQLDQSLFLHGTYRKTELRNLITFRTVIPYRERYDINDFLFKVVSK